MKLVGNNRYLPLTGLLTFCSKLYSGCITACIQVLNPEKYYFWNF